jgi:hypothetical protein
MLIMPPEIADAVSQIMLNVEGLVRDKDNKFAGYRFTSHDQIKEKVGKLMAKAGLTLVCDETSAEVQDKYLKCHYEIYLYHSSGASYGPVNRRIMVSANGPQAFGIAASYVQKYFLRDLLQIPTGEKEADQEPEVDLPSENKKEIDIGKLYADMEEDLNACDTLQELEDWVELYKPQKPLLRKAQQVLITKQYNERKDELKEKVNG